MLLNFVMPQQLRHPLSIKARCWKHIFMISSRSLIDLIFFITRTLHSVEIPKLSVFSQGSHRIDPEQPANESSCYMTGSPHQYMYQATLHHHRRGRVTSLAEPLATRKRDRLRTSSQMRLSIQRSASSVIYRIWVDERDQQTILLAVSVAIR